MAELPITRLVFKDWERIHKYNVYALMILDILIDRKNEPIGQYDLSKLICELTGRKVFTSRISEAKRYLKSVGFIEEIQGSGNMPER